MAAAAEQHLELGNWRLAMRIGEVEHGAIVSFRANNGDELIARQEKPLLFALTLSRSAALPGERFTLTNLDAKRFQAQWQEQGVVLSYDGFPDGPTSVVCTAKLTAEDPYVRWRIAVHMPDNLVLEAVRFPIVTLRAPLAANGEEDAVVLGSTKGGVIRNLASLKTGPIASISQPGSMAAQFGCYYGPRGGFFTAAFDGRGYPKNLMAARVKEGVELSWSQAGFATGEFRYDYDVAMTTFAGAGDRPTDWRDAADLYKTWALTQPWCATTYDRRSDIPAWMKEGPAMVRFNREWLAEPARIERWLREYWKKRFVDAPLITAYWGWEKIGSWVTPDYFPVFPGDEQFKQLVAHSRALGCHAFPWPSGYHWTLTYRKRADGSFEFDDRNHFDETAGAHAVQTRDGKIFLSTPPWLQGGDTSFLCGGDPWTVNWWNQEVCVPLAQRGCEMIQVDQVVGGSFPACFNPAHPHPAGPGLWQTECFARQLQTMRQAMSKIQADAVVCYEEPNEWFNHLVGIQDYRDCEAPYEWASVFNYLYHEFLPPFQSNERSGDLVMAAHCLVDGQIPHLVPSIHDAADGTDPLLINGGFEPSGGMHEGIVGWEQVHGYQGQTWNGVAVSDAQEKHGGAASLRLDNADATDIVQVSQNVNVGMDGLAAGKQYRLGAWLKTDHMAKANRVGFVFLAADPKAAGPGGHLDFPAAGAGWQNVRADFAVPGGAEKLRIMIHIVGAARAWVDDITLEEILSDGSTKPAVFAGNSPRDRFMQRWVALYHGEGRPWLQFGRMLHPPALTCATATYQAYSRGKNGVAVLTARTLPAVLNNAFVAPDGKEAVVLANPTLTPQQVTLRWHNKTQELTVPPADAMLVR